MQKAKQLKAIGSHGTVGIEIVLSVLLGLLIGTKLDEWAGTKPWLTLLWFGFGCLAAGRAVYRSWKSMQIAAKREEAEEGNPAPAFPDEKAQKWQQEEEKARKDAESVEQTAVLDGQSAATKRDVSGEDS